MDNSIPSSMHLTFPSERVLNAYFDGMRAGCRAYAWWKDGVQYVGTCGMTLKDALKSIERERQNELEFLEDGNP